LAEGVGLFPVEGEAEGTLCHEAVYPGAGVGVDAEVGECRECRGGVEVIEEAGDIEEKNSTDIPASDGHLGLVAEEGGGVRRGMVLPQAELRWTDEIEVSLICAESVSDNFLEKFTCALKE
jgi:hypothetical protein